MSADIAAALGGLFILFAGASVWALIAWLLRIPVEESFGRKPLD